MTTLISRAVPVVISRATVSSRWLLASLCFSALLSSAQSLPHDPQLSTANNCNVSTTMFNSFFHTPPGAVNGEVDPANSVTFSNDTSKHNCDFYQWAEQMFLWLTSPAPQTYGGGGGRIFASPAFFTVSPADSNGKRTLIANPARGPLRFLGVRAAQVGAHGLPVIMSKSGQMFEVQPGPVSKSGKPLVLNRAGKRVEVGRTAIRAGKVVLLDTTGKIIVAPKLVIRTQIPLLELQRLRPQQQQRPEPVPPHEMMRPTAAHVQVLRRLTPAPIDPKLIAQQFIVNKRPIFLNLNGGVIETEEGQADDSVLIAQNGSLIYYITMVNDVMAYFLTGTKDGGITPTPIKFPTSSADLTKITSFASTHGKTFPDPNALAIEVKSSWIETTGISNPSDYITTEAVIPVFDTTTDPTHWKATGQSKTTTLALVGMHVVGSANGHPEMIWSTFEHFGNAPNATYNYNATTTPPPNPHSVSQSTTGTWLFCANGSSGPFNQAKAQFISPDIVGINGATIGPSDIIRFKPFGAALGTQPNPLIADDPTSNSQLIGIDDSIQSDFAALSNGPDVRANYYMTGATWTEGGNPPNGSFPTGIDVGTSQLANTTMETFQQTTSSFNAHSNNCFSCHLTNQLSVSHVACDPGHGCTAGIQPLF